MNIRHTALPLVLALACGSAHAGNCKTIRGDLFEIAATVGCNPGLASCFLGAVHGNHGFNGITHFHADSGAAGPATSPGFVSYGGAFEYRTAQGTIYARETGVTDPGVVTAYQKIVDGTGKYRGATGHFFVSGFKTGSGADTTVTTDLIGEICYAGD